uniref:FHA domain-containing protein n=1 Tax=Glossina palpalis gambiensis TaxID=67801 RepID=A0A1B0ARI7_9MUSC
MQHIDAKHCVLEVDSKEEIFIVDLESDSGVYGNNKRVGALTKERLQLDEDFGLGEQLKAQIKRRDAKHCYLEVLDSTEAIFITDLESDSGIFINNKPVGPLTTERQDIADPSPTIQRLGQSGTYLHEVSANMKASK